MPILTESWLALLHRYFRHISVFYAKMAHHPPFPLLQSAGEEKFARHDVVEWLSPGQVRIIAQRYGTATATMPTPRNTQSIYNLVFRLTPRHKWYDDIPLGRACMRIATNQDIIVPEGALNEDALRRLALEDAAIKVRYREEVGEERKRIHAFFKKRLWDEPEQVFRVGQEKEFWAAVDDLERRFDAELTMRRFWVFGEDTADANTEGWSGAINVFDLSEFQRIERRLERLRLADETWDTRLRNWRKELKKRLANIAQEAAVK